MRSFLLILIVICLARAQELDKLFSDFHVDSTQDLMNLDLLDLSSTLSPTYEPTHEPTQHPTTEYTDEPSLEPTLMPSLMPTFMPSAVPSITPTTGPSVMPTLMPTTGPSVMPTVMPSTMPTLMPTVMPSTMPTVMPSAVPTIAPSVAPSFRPSAVPTTYAPNATPVPTFAPTVQTSPVIAFANNITLAGVTSPTLDDNAINAVLNATAVSMKTIVAYLEYHGDVVIPTSTSARSKKVLTNYNILVIIVAKIPLSSSSFTSAAQLYNYTTSNLKVAVDSGSFGTTLQTASVTYGATSVSGATATSVSSTTYIVSYPPASSNDDDKHRLSGGAIAGIVIGTVIGFFLLVAGCYYAYMNRDSLPLASDRRKDEMDIML